LPPRVRADAEGGATLDTWATAMLSPGRYGSPEIAERGATPLCLSPRQWAQTCRVSSTPSSPTSPVGGVGAGPADASPARRSPTPSPRGPPVSIVAAGPADTAPPTASPPAASSVVVTGSVGGAPTWGALSSDGGATGAGPALMAPTAATVGPSAACSDETAE